VDSPDYTVAKLVMSRRFRRWVKHPNAKLEAFWADWIAEKPGRRALVEEARQIVLSLDFPDNLTEAEIAQEWQKVQPLLAQYPRREETRVQRNFRIPTIPTYWQAAVWVGLLVCAGLVYAFLAQTATIRLATGNGEVKTVTLPDGSVVTLNANSKLSFPEAWAADQAREVQLEGEAFFSVVHQANHRKFIVRTADPFRVEVLGTTFTVLDRADRNRVVLGSGKVRLQAEIAGRHESIVMQPGELVEVAEHAARPVRKRVNPDVYTAFKDGKLLFDNTPLREVAQILEDIYGLEVHVPGAEVAAREFTGTFPLDDLPLLLQVLGRTYHLDMIRAGNQLQMRPKPVHN